MLIFTIFAMLFYFIRRKSLLSPDLESNYSSVRMGWNIFVKVFLGLSLGGAIMKINHYPYGREVLMIGVLLQILSKLVLFIILPSVYKKNKSLD